MKEFWTEFVKALSGKDGPLIWGITAITALTLGWKFLDKNYQAEGKDWKIYPSDTETNVRDTVENERENANSLQPE